MAKVSRPTAEIPVSQRRTRGLAKITDALSIAATRLKYQVVETIDCTATNTIIPTPRLKFFGTKSGINATAKTAA